MGEMHSIYMLERPFLGLHGLQMRVRRDLSEEKNLEAEP